MSDTLNGYGALRRVLEEHCTAEGCSLKDLTVLSKKADPYRVDIPTGHRVGAWVAEQLDRLLGDRRTHLRGLHYAIVVTGDTVKPDGSIYRNTDDDWMWLSETAGKAARWLGYVEFDRIFDNRNAAPVINRKAKEQPGAFVSIGLDVDIPDLDDIEPLPCALGFKPRQPFCFSVFGEKTSLQDVVEPIAERHEADVYLGSGEMSDTLIHQIAKDAAADGRPLVVFTLTDCDPAGHQMTISIGRKLQAFRDLLFPTLRFELVPVALTVEQVRELGLPSTPLKETEKRADRWRQAFGIEQTEIDALATLRPDVLRDILDAAFDPYIDRTLRGRVTLAEVEWRRQAQEALDEQIDQDMLEDLRSEAAVRLSELQSAIDDINYRLRLAADDRFTLPKIEVPQPELDETRVRQALTALDDDWITATRALIRRKAYEGDAS